MKGCPLMTRPSWPPSSSTSINCFWSILERTVRKITKRMRRTTMKTPLPTLCAALSTSLEWIQPSQGKGKKMTIKMTTKRLWRRPTRPVLLFRQATKNLRWSDGAPDSPYLVLEAFSEPVTIMWLSIYAAPDSPDCDSVYRLPSRLPSSEMPTGRQFWAHQSSRLSTSSIKLKHPESIGGLLGNPDDWCTQNCPSQDCSP